MMLIKKIKIVQLVVPLSQRLAIAGDRMARNRGPCLAILLDHARSDKYGSVILFRLVYLSHTGLLTCAFSHFLCAGMFCLALKFRTGVTLQRLQKS